MGHVFISYAKEDRDFAELMIAKLEAASLKIWADVRSIAIGTQWRQGIDEGIWTCDAFAIVMSPEAKKSEYVTYEWAFAFGAKKDVVPILVKDTTLHPRLDALQHIDFTTPARPWDKLIARLKSPVVTAEVSVGPATLAKAHIWNYLERKEIDAVSFSAIRQYINERYDDAFLLKLIEENPQVFRKTTIKGKGTSVGRANRKKL